MSQERLTKQQFYFDTMSIGFLVVNKERIITDVNPYLCKMSGYEREEIIGQSTAMFHLSKESYETWVKEVFRQAAIKDIINIQVNMKKKDGTTIWVDIAGQPLHHNRTFDGGSIVWSAFDITKQKTDASIINFLNDELNNNIAYLRTLIDIIPLPVSVKDSNFHYTECNKAFTQLTGFLKSKIIGKTELDIVLDKVKAQILFDKDKELLLEEEQFIREGISYGEKEYMFELHKAALRQEGMFTGLITIMVDVTQQVKNKVLLEAQVETALIDKYEQEQFHVKEQLKNVQFAAIGKLAAGIIHEINTPLTYMKGNIELMGYDIADLEPSRLKDRLFSDSTSLLSAVGRISNIINAMREMSQKSKEEKVKIDLFDTLHTSLTIVYNRSKYIVEVKIMGKPFDIDTKYDQEACYVLGQRQRIEQVWIIIVNNALDKLSKIESFEARSLNVMLKRENSYAVVSFQDNAGGIDVNMLDTIFESFNSTKEHGGMGVGLSIAQNIVYEHDGTIEATNYQDGALFEVRLPIYAFAEY